MMRNDNMKLLVASKNKKKIAELERILSPLGFQPVCETDLGIALPEVDETGTTFYENALLKATSAMKNAGCAAVADDSGLCVDALGGAPGIYSARFSGEGANDVKNNAKLLDMLKDVPLEKRTAQFVSCVCVVFPNGDIVSAEGSVSGIIDYEPHGEGGFGYDPLFTVDGVSFAQMSKQQKDEISHRGRALRNLKEKLEVYLNVEQ